jgi:hypothetical protein
MVVLPFAQQKEKTKQDNCSWRGYTRTSGHYHSAKSTIIGRDATENNDCRGCSIKDID